MNFFVIWLTNKFMRVNASFTRILSTAAMGAMYVVIASLPSFNWLFSFFPKLILSCVMIINILANQMGNIFFCFRYAAVFYLITFSCGGAILSLSYLMAGETSISNMVYTTQWPVVGIYKIVAGIILTLLLGFNLHKYLKQNNLKHHYIMPFSIFLNGNQKAISGLVDTGNHLVEPVTGNPVIVVEYQAIAEMLPSKMFTLMTGDSELNVAAILQVMDDENLKSKICLIPFSSVGRQHGIMIGIRIDTVAFVQNGQKIEQSNAVIALSPRALCSQNSYQALINPQFIS